MPLRTIGLEEHTSVPELQRAAEGLGGIAGMALALSPEFQAVLEDMGEGRLADMDANGIDMQVLSLQPPWDEVDAVLGEKAVRAYNEAAAAAVAAHPDRFAFFAAVPVHDPVAAAKELEYAVGSLGAKGALLGTRMHTGFLSQEVNWPFWEAAERLGVPVYMHPSVPPQSVFDTYYADMGPMGVGLSIAMWGWHVDTGMQVMRLILQGVFDRFPRLQVIIGHMGEATPFMLGRVQERLDFVQSLVPGFAPPFAHPVRHYFRNNIHITTSGFFDPEPLRCAIDVVGADRILFSVDYPWSSSADGRAFIDSAPIDEDQRHAIAHGNAERLLGLPTATD